MKKLPIEVTAEIERSLRANTPRQAWAFAGPPQGQAIELPTVVNAKDCPKDWQSDPQYVYIGRPNKRLNQPGSMFANPFPVGKRFTRDEAIEKYCQRFGKSLLLQAQAKAWLPGKVLVCCCKPLPCHGDMLVDFLAKNCKNKRDASDCSRGASTITTL